MFVSNYPIDISNRGFTSILGVRNTYLSWRKRGMLFTSWIAIAMIKSDCVRVIGLKRSPFTFPMMLKQYCLISFIQDSTIVLCCPPVGVWVWTKDIRHFSCTSTTIAGLMFFGMRSVPWSEMMFSILPKRY